MDVPVVKPPLVVPPVNDRVSSPPRIDVSVTTVSASNCIVAPGVCIQYWSHKLQVHQQFGSC